MKFYSEDTPKAFWSILIIGVILATVFYFTDPKPYDALLTLGIAVAVAAAIKIGDYLNRDESTPRGKR